MRALNRMNRDDHARASWRLAALLSLAIHAGAVAAAFVWAARAPGSAARDAIPAIDVSVVASAPRDEARIGPSRAMVAEKHSRSKMREAESASAGNPPPISLAAQATAQTSSPEASARPTQPGADPREPDLAAAEIPSSRQPSAASAAYAPPDASAAYLENAPPRYPESARRRGQSGRVLLEAQIGADGAAQQVRIRESSGFRTLDQAAEEAVARWRFVPARQGGESVAASVAIPVVFRLNDR